MKIIFCMLLILYPCHALSSDIDECYFKQSKGTCSADISIDESNNSYTIPASGDCRTVTVLIDGTQYPHKQKDANIVDNVMKIDKSKNYSVSVSGCTLHPTNAEVNDKCTTMMSDATVQCDGLAPAVKCAGSENPEECAASSMSDFTNCVEGAVASAETACLGSPFF